MTDVQGLACLLMTQPPAKRQKSVARIKQWAANNGKPEQFLADVLAEAEKLCTGNGQEMAAC